MADYFGVAEAIATQISSYTSAHVVVEEALMMGEGNRVFIYRENRSAPDDWQILNGSNAEGIRIHCNFSIWCFTYGINIKRAMEARDDLLGDVELALMSNTTFGRSDVIASWLEGGDFDHALMQPGLCVGAEIKLLVVVDTRLTDIALDLEDGGFLLLEGDEDGNHLELQ